MAEATLREYARAEHDDAGTTLVKKVGNYGWDGTNWIKLSSDANGNLRTISGITGINHGVKTVTTAGTDETLVASTTAVKRVIIQAQTDNTGFIAIGTAGVDATEATGTGVLLTAGDSVEFDIDDLVDISIDATADGEGVRFTYFT